ncbi:hypothetical protein BC943DRAFT_227086 [Umbelopsis sp. AD052]|nr:hypothetical protein BC943DRAFT_227086 [Umbelopsis sp. AD052]
MPYCFHSRMSLLVRSRPQLVRSAYRAYSTSSTSSHGLRAGLLGIIIGLGLASSVASTYVIDRYKYSQQQLLVAVQQLQLSTDQFRVYAQKIDDIAKTHAYLMANAATTADMEALRKAQRAQLNTQYSNLLYLRAHVAELENKKIYPLLAQSNP